MLREAVSELQSDLERIAKEIKALRTKRGATMSKYVVEAKNPLMGFEYLFGDSRRLSPPEAKNDIIIGAWRDYYFKDIRYRSRLKKIATRISFLESEYNQKLSELKELVNEPAVS